MPKIAGIDLGTTYSAIAILDSDGSVRILENKEGERLTPSAVNFDEHGNPVVGTVAREMSIDQPENTVQYVKRHVGEKTWNFETEKGERFSSEEISALILKRLKDDTESILGEPLGPTVITVPAYFDDARRNAVLDAAKIAGINLLGLVNEPTAAALAYGSDGKGEKGIIAVFDLGGGTFDVTVVNSDDDELRVMATGGDRNLGGFDFDNALVSKLNEEFKKSCGKDLLLETDNGEAFLREKAESMKRGLSLRESVSSLLVHSGKRCKVEVSASEFKEMTAGLVRRALDIAASVFEDALGESDSGLSPREAVERLGIKRIILVGGSTKMPMISEAIENETGIRPSRDVNPDEAVAIGAAIYAGILVSKKAQETAKSASPNDAAKIKSAIPALPSGVRNIKVSDVNSHSLGIVAVKGSDNSEFNAIVLPRNTPVPAKISQTFKTLYDNQKNLFVQVTEGEEEDISLCKVLGEAEMKITPRPKDSPIEVEFSYDANGVVHVGVTDSSSGEFIGEVIIKRSSNLNDEETEEARKRMSRLAVD